MARGAVLDPGQGQQLVGQVGQLVGALHRFLQRGPPDLRLFGPQAQFDARLECRQGRAQLMGGIGDELRLPLELNAQAFGEMVERLHQRPQLALHLHQRQGAQVIGLTVLDFVAQALQWPQRRADRDPHQQQRADPQHAQAQQGVGHQTAGH